MGQTGIQIRQPIAASLGPIAAAERVPALDVLRAVALFFIFLVNMEYFVRPLEAHGLGIEPGLEGVNHALAWSEYVFVERKAWCLFAFLFGMGFAVMQDRARASGHGFVLPYVRRTLALLLLGALHIALVWAGDVLHTYAFAGAALLVMMVARPRWLLLPVPLFALAVVLLGGRGYLGGMIGFLLLAIAAAWIRRGGVDRLWKAGVMLYLSPALVITMMTLPGLFSPPDPAAVAARAERLTAIAGRVEQVAAIHSTGSYAQNVALRVRDVAESLPDETRLLVAAVGLFLVGVWFVRSGVVGDLGRHRTMLARNTILCLPLGALLSVASALVSTGLDPRQPERWLLASQLMQVSALLISIGAASGVLYLLASGRRFDALAPVGRMALTNYLMQSVLCTLTFYGYGLGLADQVDRVGQLLLAIAIFGTQVVLSSWWLRRFRFGPVEWGLRSVTYGGFPRMLRFPPARELATPATGATSQD